MQDVDHLPRGRCLALLALPVAMMLPGCLVGPNYRPPKAQAPNGWAGLSPQAATQPSAAADLPADLAQWWQTFNDSLLTSLIEQALEANLDLQLAEARVRQARASRGVAFGALLPSAGASAAYTRSRPRGSGPGVTEQDLFQAGLDASWEIDLFGGRRRGVEAADAGIVAAYEARRNTQVTLAAEIALDYVSLRGFQRQIAIAQSNLKAQQHTADITRQRKEAGFVSSLDVANADAQVATTRSQIPVLQTAERQAIYALSVLLARAPADLIAQLSQPGPPPVTPPQVPIGLPSDLLRRRPDIRQAEANLHAATAQIGVATADLFPRFSLTGSINWQGNSLETWLTPVSRSWAFGPSVSWTPLQGGAIVSNIRVQEALRDQACITYRQTVLTALQEVENALIAFAKEQEHRQALQQAAEANRMAVDLSTQLYTQGNTDFLNVLNAQRSLYGSEDALVQSNTNVANDLIALYKALGGGWEEAAPDQSPASQPASAPSER